MELRNVITFLQAAEMGNFTHAANQLGYAQSTVTIQIKQLETELGYQLFDRVGNRISLTPRGEEFRYYANQLVSISQQIKLIPSRETESLHGTLRIGILESIFFHILLPLLPAYHKRFPNITIQTKMGTGHELFSQLRHNELDMIFTLGEKMLEKDCVRAYAEKTDVYFVAAAGPPYARRGAQRFSEICRMPLILTERDSVYRSEMERAAAQRDIEIDPVLEVNSTSAITSLVKLGMGVSLLPDYVISSPSAHGEMQILDVPDCRICLWRQIYYHKSKWVTPQMAGMIDAVTGACRSGLPGGQTKKGYREENGT